MFPTTCAIGQKEPSEAQPQAMKMREGKRMKIKIIGAPHCQGKYLLIRARLLEISKGGLPETTSLH